MIAVVGFEQDHAIARIEQMLAAMSRRDAAGGAHRSSDGHIDEAVWHRDDAIDAKLKLRN